MSEAARAQMQDAFATLFATGEGCDVEDVDMQKVLEGMHLLCVWADEWQWPTKLCPCCCFKGMNTVLDELGAGDDDTTDLNQATLSRVLYETCRVISVKDHRENFAVLLAGIETAVHKARKPEQLLEQVVEYMVAEDIKCATQPGFAHNARRLAVCNVFVAFAWITEAEKSPNSRLYPMARAKLMEAWRRVGQDRAVGVFGQEDDEHPNWPVALAILNRATMKGGNSKKQKQQKKQKKV